MPDPNLPPLIYSEGWRDILTSPDAADCQHQMQELCRGTMRQLPHEPWAKSEETVQRRWQTVIEGVASYAILEDDRREMTESQIVETALLTVITTIEDGGWEEECVSLLVSNLAEGTTMVFDVRTPLDARELEQE